MVYERRAKALYRDKSGLTVAADQHAGLGRARLLVDRLLVSMSLAAAQQAQGVGVGAGARSPVGPARAAVELVELVEPTPGGRARPVTPLGYRTARSRLPRVLRALDPGDGRRHAAARYGTVHEMVGAAPVSAVLSSGGGSARVSDGGAVWRVGIAAELRGYHIAIGGGTALVPRSRRGARRAITVRVLVDMVCLSGLEIKAVLRAHGWGVRAGLIQDLGAELLAALDRMAKVEERGMRARA